MPRPRSKPLGLLTTVVLLLLPGVAGADIVLHDGGVNKDRDAAKRVEARTGHAPRLVLPSDVLAGPTQVLSGKTIIERCEGGSMTLDLDGKLAQVEENVLAFEPEAALETLSIVSTLLPCADSVVPTETLAKLAFLRGAALSDLGSDEATGAMAEALAVVPLYQGIKGFPRAHSDLLKETGQRVKSLPDGRLFLWPGPGTNNVYVNGEKREQVHSVGIALRPGLHLVQLVIDDKLQGLWVGTGSRFTAVVFPGAGRAAWADGGRSPGGELAMMLMLDDGFHGREGDIHTLRYRGRSVMGATWPVGGAPRVAWPTKKRRGSAQKDQSASKQKRGTTSGGSDDSAATKGTDADGEETTGDTASTKSGWTDARLIDSIEAKPQPETEDPLAGDDSTPSTASSEPDSSPPPGDVTSPGSKAGATEAESRAPKRFRVVVGGGYHFADPFSYGLLAVDFSVRVVGPLQVAAWVRPSIGGVYNFPVPAGQEPVSGPLGFMPVGAGAGVFLDTRLSPYVRASFQFAYNRDGLSSSEYLVGAAIQGGLEYQLPAAPIVLSVQGEVGFLGPHFNARVWGGVGFAF